MAPTTQLHPHALPGRRYGEFGGRAPTIDGVRTALQEQVGGSIIAGFDTDYRLRLPYGYGGCRFYGLIPQGAGLSAILPRTTDPRGGPFHPYCNPGGLPSATIVNAGAFPLAVVTNEHAPVVTLAPLAAASFRVRPGGGWLVKHHGTAGIGATLADRVPVEVPAQVDARQNRTASALGPREDLPDLLRILRQLMHVDDVREGSENVE